MFQKEKSHNNEIYQDKRRYRGGGGEGEIKTLYIVNGEDNLFTNSMNLMTFILID